MPWIPRLLAATIIAFGATAIMLAWRAAPTVSVPITRLDETLYDSLYQFRPFEDRTNGDIVILAVDQEALAKIDSDDGYKHGWPWPRAYWGSLLEYLAEDCHAKAVVFDVLFSERSVNAPDADGKADDALFAEAIERARKTGSAGIVFANDANKDGTFGRFTPPVKPPPIFGADNISDSEKWRLYLPTRYGLPSLAVSALKSAGIAPRLPADKPFLAHYYGPHKGRDGRQTFRYFSAANVIYVSYGADEADWHVHKEMFRDKIVLVGLVATGTYDEKATPLSPKCPGVEVQATAIENLIHGDEVRRLGWPVTALATLLTAWLASLGVTLPRQAWLKTLLAALAIAAVCGVAVGLFVKHDIVWLPLAAPLLAGIVATIGAFAWSFFGEDRQRRRLLKALSSVVSPTIAEELARDPSKLAVGGTRREMTVMFTDIAGFTDLSETMPPEKLAPMLNYYLEEMSGIVLHQSGTLDKYIGDAIMSFWNAPLPQVDHAARACRAALRLVERETAIQPELQKLGAKKIYTRVGINSGPMAVGFTGSSHLINYTVLGDSVNLGSRLEGANKLYGTRIMLSQSTADLVKGQFVLRRLDSLRVKGKLEPMPVYELIAEGQPDPTTARRVGLYEEAFDLYQRQRWDEAEKNLLEILAAFPEDAPSKAMQTRIAHFREEAPPGDWDGVYVAKDK